MVPTGENGEWHVDQSRMSGMIVNHDGKFTDINKNYLSFTTGDIGMPSTNWCSYETTFTCGETTTSQAEDLCSLTIMLGSGLSTTIKDYTGNENYVFDGAKDRWYIDDVIVEQISGSVSETRPNITSIQATGDQSAAENVLSVVPAYSGVKPLIGYGYRVYRNDGGAWAELASGFTADDSINYTISANDVGKTIKVDVVAYDTENEFSAMKTQYFNIEPAILNTAFADGKLTGTVTHAEGEIMVVFVAFYDNSGRLVDVVSIDVKASAKTSVDISENVPAGAEKAKVMVWNSFRNMIPKCDATDYIILN